MEVQECGVFIKEPAVARMWWEMAPLLVTDEVCKWGPLACPTLTVPDGVLLSLFFLVAVPADRARVSRSVGARPSLLGMVPPGKVVEKKTELPGGALGGTFGARKPGASEHVEALADRG